MTSKAAATYFATQNYLEYAFEGATTKEIAIFTICVVLLLAAPEEIVGNIYDEFDKEEEPSIEKIGDNLWCVPGSTNLDELSEELDLPEELPEEGYDTIAGLVINLLEAIPEDGEKIDVEGYGLHIHVEDIKDRRIEKAYVSKLDATA